MYVHEYYEIPYSTEKSNNMRWEKLKDKFLKNNMSLSICNTRLSKKKTKQLYTRWFENINTDKHVYQINIVGMYVERIKN